MEVRHYHWKDGKSLIVGERTLVMGVLNYTPDSFSDGGKWNNVDVALKHMEEMVADGADIIDIGAESMIANPTKPTDRLLLRYQVIV